MYKKIILSFFYTLFLLFHITALSAKTFKIATWNVEWLISQEDIKNTPIPNDITLRKPTDFKLLLQYTQKLNADIIALQEVGSLETLNAIFPKNQYLFFFSKDVIAQHTALAIRKNIVEHIQNNSDFTELSKMNISHPLRSGLDITIYTKQNSLRILVLHLKSGCQDYPLDHLKLKEPCILLKKQFSLLQQWIYKRLAEKQAFIILGDFNRVISAHDLLFKKLYNTSVLTFPTSNKANPCWNGSYFIDGFILDSNATKWIIPDTLRVMKYTEQDYDKQNTLSDHCPVSIKLLIP